MVINDALWSSFKVFLSLLILIMIASLLASSSPAKAEEEVFTWEGDWVLYFSSNGESFIWESDEPYWTITIGQNADGSFDEFWDQDMRYRFEVQGYTIKIINDIPANPEERVWTFYLTRTTNPNQLVGYWNESVPNSGNVDIPWACAARNGEPRPEPCSLDNSNILEEDVTPIESGSDSNEGDGSLPVSLFCQPAQQPGGKSGLNCTAEIYPPDDIGNWNLDWYLDGQYVSSLSIDHGSTQYSFWDVETGSHTVTVNVTNAFSDVELAGSAGVSVLIDSEPVNSAAPMTEDNDTESSEPDEADVPDTTDTAQGEIAPSDGVSPGAQAGAAVVTTGALAFWFIWEFLTLFSSVQSSPLQSLLGLLSSSGPSPGKPPAAPTQQQTQPPPVPDKSPAFTGAGGKFTEIFGGGDVHAILQGLDLIPDDVDPEGALDLTQAGVDNLLSGHADGLPHEITLPNGDTVIVDNIQGIAFHGDNSGTQVDFSQGISIVAEIVKPDPTPGQLAVPTPTPQPPALSDQSAQPLPSQPSDQTTVPPQPVDNQYVQPQAAQSQTAQPEAEQHLVGDAVPEATDKNRIDPGWEAAEQPLTDDVDNLGERAGEEQLEAEPQDEFYETEEDPPEADMIDGEVNSSTEDF